MTTQTTLVAIATAPGRGGIGVVRLSGSKALAIAKQLTGRQQFTPRTATFCAFKNADSTWIDDGLVLYFPAPHSFTGEQVVELQGHGGPVILDMLVRACIRLGATQAGPGEFSLRAFLNDKFDLTQAEAIADMIDAGTESAARAAHRSLQGAFSTEVDQLVTKLIELRVQVEAAIDFPDEEIDFLSDGRIRELLANVITQVKRVQQSARSGRLLRDGMTLVIAGKPNAGKSSLLNALTGVDAAIVTDQAGTTRDTLKESIQLDGIPLHIIDTAGLRESEDQIEQEGIRRAREALKQADVVLFIADSTEPRPSLNSAQALLQQEVNLPFTWVLNKADLSASGVGKMPDHDGHPAFSISARLGDGLDALKAHIKQLAGWQDNNGNVFSARQRHLGCIERCLDTLEIGQTNLLQHQAGELLAEDLRASQQALEEITGAFSADDLLGEIFGSFCIGK